MARIQQFPSAWPALTPPPPPVIEAAAKPLYDLCDFVKHFLQHGVPVSTSRTDAPWVMELHCEAGAPVIKLIKYSLTSAAPDPPGTCGASGPPRGCQGSEGG